MSKLKILPSVSLIMKEAEGRLNIHENYLKILINKELDYFRKKIISEDNKIEKDQIIDTIITKIAIKASSSLVNIINGTGIVLHTGLGRAPFNGERLKEVADKLDGYINLEFDVSKNKRGDRQSHIDEHLASICGSESSLVVNNNAAAVLLSINALASGSEVICSRGQIVEIGGSFRISEIIEKSGAILKEVGTTNRTHINDYEKAISDKTKLLLWVHTSNYVVKGYTKEVALEEIVKLGKNNNIPVLADLGSGTFLSLDKYGIPTEIPIIDVVRKGPDIILFSGDKMLGGPQSGIILGSKNIIDLIKSNTLYRTMRCDKITIVLLDQIIRSYRIHGFSKLNLTLSLLTSTRGKLKNTAEDIIKKLPAKKIKTLGISIEDSLVEAGSGSLPEKNIESITLKFKSTSFSANKLSLLFREGDIPVIGYIHKNSFFIDLKAVLPSQVSNLIRAIKNI
ncbi:MAG: L-seryl-tRNA(Sec) selenium transferase [Candidatus Neomarinimicrobiota bacterium]|nr:L-seryl-tRNA(Sec) selenium transferase [Candidatus Neomarinimicrobiota bacterium]